MFGEEFGPCGHCDVCQGAVRLIEGSVDAQKALSAILRTSGRFYFGHLANILSGKTTGAVERHGHDQLKTFGVGRDRTPADWRGVLRQLQSARLIERDPNDRDRLILTDMGQRVLRGETRFALREDVLNRKERRVTHAAGQALRSADAALLTALKALRASLATAHKQPAYVIFADRTLIEMAKARPKSLDELSSVHGVGAVKLQSTARPFWLSFETTPMPELPEVETVRRGLEPAMLGARIDKVELRRTDIRFPFPPRFASRLKGRRIVALARRAKYLLFQLDAEETLIAHLGMSGSFRIEAATTTIPGSYHRERGKDPKHDHVVLHLDNGSIVTYNDPRRFGFMDLVADKALDFVSTAAWSGRGAASA